MKRDRYAEGLTLLELLLTLTIFSAVIGLLLNSFVQLKRQNRQIGAVLTLRQEARVLEKLLKEDISAAVYLKEFMNMAQYAQDGRKSGIVGTSEKYGKLVADVIHMHSRTQSKFQRTLPFESDPELYEVSYYLDIKDESNPQFKRREELYIDSDITDGKRSITHTLSRRVVSFDVKYYEGFKSKEGEEWDSTPRGGSLPVGIKIAITLKDREGKMLESEFQINIRPSMGSYAHWQS